MGRTSCLSSSEFAGYLSYDGRYGDLLFEVVSRRHLKRSTVLTSNKAFSEWTQVLAGASCVVRLEVWGERDRPLVICGPYLGEIRRSRSHYPEWRPDRGARHFGVRQDARHLHR